MSRHAADIDDAADTSGSMTRAACFRPSITPRTLTARTWSTVATSVSVMLIIGEGIPALLTRQSRRPTIDGLVDHHLDIRFLFAGHVRTDETNAVLFLERTTFRFSASDDHDLSAFSDEDFGDRFADAARGWRPGDDRDLFIQCAHGPPPIAVNVLTS